MNNLEYACKKLGWQGGTIHQLAKETGVDATELLVMPQDKLGELLGVRWVWQATVYWDCLNCGNSFREGEAEDQNYKCTCGKALTSEFVKDEKWICLHLRKIRLAHI